MIGLESYLALSREIRLVRYLSQVNSTTTNTAQLARTQ